MTYRTSSEEETIAVGELISERLERHSVVLLTGELGAGKTTIAKGIAKGLGAAEAEDVSSPTYTLIHEYGRDVYHVDLYRLDDWREVQAIGLEELLDSAAVVLIEWGERFPELVKRATLEIRLEADGTARTIVVTPSRRDRDTDR